MNLYAKKCWFAIRRFYGRKTYLNVVEEETMVVVQTTITKKKKKVNSF